MTPTRGYRDHDWHEAARQIVHAELIQAIGRARPVCPDGIPLTIVLSSEPLGLPLADDKLEVINKRVAQNAALVIYHLLDCVGALSSGTEGEQVPDGEDYPALRDCFLNGCQGEIATDFAYRIFFKRFLPLILADTGWDRCPTVKTPELTRRLGIPDRTARQLFADLEHFGLLTREGKRKGWYLTANNLRMFDRLPEYLFGEATQTASPVDREQQPAQEEPLLGHVMAAITSWESPCEEGRQKIAP